MLAYRMAEKQDRIWRASLSSFFSSEIGKRDTCREQNKDALAGGDAFRGNTRSHPEHDG